MGVIATTEERNSFKNGLDVTRFLQPDTMDRFWSKVDTSGECWLWIAGRRNFGYGQFMLAPAWDLAAHRVSYALNVGPIPPGQMVRHTCDNPPCVHPEHLELGTPRDNFDDQVARNRRPIGPRCQGILTPETVLVIRAAARTREAVAALAEQFGVLPRAIRAAQSGKTWKHVTFPRLPQGVS